MAVGPEGTTGCVYGYKASAMLTLFDTFVCLQTAGTITPSFLW